MFVISINNIIVMPEQPSFIPMNIKITFKNLTRLQPIKEADYKAFIKSLYYHFALKQSNCYHLFYNKNKHEDVITIKTEKDYISFINARRREGYILNIEETNDRDQHFVEGQQDYRQSMALFQAKSSALKQQIQSELNRQRIKLQEQIKEEYKDRLSKLNKQAQGIDNDNIHQGINCSVCSQTNIKGVRYECAICDYHLCQSCESTVYKHPSNHPMIKIKYQWQKLKKKENQLSKKEQYKKEKGNFVSELMEILNLSERVAELFIKKHPNAGLNELVEMHISKGA